MSRAVSPVSDKRMAWRQSAGSGASPDPKFGNGQDRPLRSDMTPTFQIHYC
jgi:hypothetical protein